jgi:hypothetical protein
MAKFTPNRHGIRQYLQHSPELRRELHRRAILGQGVAAALAPYRTGTLSTTSEVRDDGPNGGIHGDRMQFSIHFTVRYAVPATYPQRRAQERAYLEAAIRVMEAGR